MSVLIEPIHADGFRASCGEPIPASAEGTTRDEALSRLRDQIASRVQAGAEVVRLRINGVRVPPAEPVWPDDEFTRDWLAGIAEARAAADQRPDPWDTTADQP